MVAIRSETRSRSVDVLYGRKLGLRRPEWRGQKRERRVGVAQSTYIAQKDILEPGLSSPSAELDTTGNVVLGGRGRWSTSQLSTEDSVTGTEKSAAAQAVTDATQEHSNHSHLRCTAGGLMRQGVESSANSAQLHVK